MEMNEILRTDGGVPTTGRPTPSAAWRLLSESFTGFDWHGGFYAAPGKAAPRPAPRRTGLKRWVAARRAARELAQLTSRERADARLPRVSSQRPVPGREALHERVAAWAFSRTPGDPYLGGAA